MSYMTSMTSYFPYTFNPYTDPELQNTHHHRQTDRQTDRQTGRTDDSIVPVADISEVYMVASLYRVIVITITLLQI